MDLNALAELSDELLKLGYEVTMTRNPHGVIRFVVMRQTKHRGWEVTQPARSEASVSEAGSYLEALLKTLRKKDE